MECAAHQQRVRASPDVCKDVYLFLHVLDKAAAGVNLNLITFCMPMRIYRADAFPVGLGGYILQGRA